MLLLIQNNFNIHVHMVDRTNLHLVLSLEVDVNMLYGIHHHIYHIGVTENRKMNQSLYGTHHHTYHIEVTENRKMNQSLYGTHHHTYHIGVTENKKNEPVMVWYPSLCT
jgi:hypothetical protein